MAKKLLPRRGAAAQHDLFTGDVGELTIDTTNYSVVVHDGITKGGHNHARDTAPLRGIKFLRRIPNVIQTTLGYHNDSNVGGGRWIYNPSRSWADHDGGTVIAYPSLALYTGTVDTLAFVLHYTPTDSGAGCFERLHINELRVESFGATLRGMTDDSSAVNKCISTASTLGFGEVHWVGVLGLTSGIKAKTGVTLVGQGWQSSRIVTLPGFTGNIYETDNFEALTISQPADTTAGCPTNYGIINCSINGQNYSGQVTAKTGYGIRLYGRQLRLSNLLIGKVKGIGLYTEFTVYTSYVDFDTLTDTKFSKISDIEIMETGYEGFIFNGPTDQVLDNIFIGWPAGSRFDQFDSTGPKTSLYFPGEPIDGFRILRSTEFGFIHSYNNNYGHAVYVKRVPGNPSIRLRGNILMGENSFGGVFIDNNVRYAIGLIESHNNVGGPTTTGAYSNLSGQNPHVTINSSQGGSCKVDIFRAGNERGSTGLLLGGVNHNVVAQVSGFDSTYVGGGKGIVNNSVYSTIDGLIASAETSNRMSVGYDEGINAKGNKVSITSRFCDINIKFNSSSPADYNNTYDLTSDRAFTEHIQNNERISRIVSKRSQISITDDGEVFKSNKFIGSAAIDFSLTTIQTVTVPHSLFRQPKEDEIYTDLSYDSGTVPNVLWKAVIGANETSITVQIRFASGGAGVGRLSIAVG